MAIEKDWDRAFLADRKGSAATRDRAWKTWTSIRNFGAEKKWDLAPSTITPKQLRLYLEHRAGLISARSVQNEASHLRRAVEGAGRVIGNVRDPRCPWSSTRLSVPESSRIGGKAAADPKKWDLAKPGMDKDVQAVVGLCSEMGLRMKESVMAGASLSSWQKQLEKPESQKLGADLRIDTGTKGGRGRFLFVPPDRIEAVLAAVSMAKECAKKSGDIVQVKGLEGAMKKVGNCIHRLGLTGADSCHGLRRAFAQEQFRWYRDSGMNEADALKRLSNDLGHGDGRGRWVSNNYLLGGSA